MTQLEELYLSYKDDLYRYLLWLTRDPSLSEDLLQETFVKAISSVGEFRGDSTIRTWLYSIARHSWQQYLQKKKPQLNYEESELILYDDLEETITDRQILRRALELLEGKDPRMKRIVELRCSGYSYYEIAESLSISESSARVIEFRARRFLLASLKKEGLL